MARICERRFELPHVSFSRACGADGRQAAHRIFSNSKTTVSGLLAGHYAQTRARCQAHLSFLSTDGAQPPGERLLVVQDTTVFKYTSHAATEGLGPIHTSENGRGLLSHAAIVLPKSGPPLGLAHLSVWARDPQEHGKRRLAYSRTKDPIEIKESQKWIDGIWGAEATLPDCPLLVICDREADIFELFAAHRSERTELLVRSRHPRRVEVEGEPAPVPLPEALGSAPLLGTMDVQVPRAPKRPARMARLHLRACQVTLRPPTTLPRPLDGSKHPKQTLFAIEAHEVDPTGPEPIRWILLTTMPVRTAEEAEQMVRTYTRRWVVEDIHLVLKSGLRAEQLQFDDAHSLMNALATLYVVAWRVLHARDTARFCPDAPASQLVTDDELEALQAAEGRTLPTVRDVVRAIACLGGFPRYPSAGEPGVRSLCAGLQRLEAILIGWRLARHRNPI
jgi:hypothetical protein